MRVVLYDELGGVALDYHTRQNTCFCPGRLEKAQVVEALQEAALFVIDGPEPTPERIFDSMYMRGTRKSDRTPSRSKH